MAVEQLNLFRLNGYTTIQYREDENISWIVWPAPGFYISAKTKIAAINKFKNYVLDMNSNVTVLDIKISTSGSLLNTSGISIMKGTKEEIINNLGNKLEDLKTVYKISST